MPAPFVFHCPDTKLSVWAIVGKRPILTQQGDIYLPVQCIACDHIHLIDPGTGQVSGIGRTDDENRPVADRMIEAVRA